MTALIGDIGRCALHDGPGIRTTVFFKGCPLNCPWCHNPELIAPRPEILFYPRRCIGCGDCADACPHDAIAGGASGVSIDRQRCNGCGECAHICPAEAVVLAGRSYNVDELVDILLRDRSYYDTSGGGVTLSGGEPTAQMDFVQALLERLRRERIHTVLMTNGHFSMDAFTHQCLDLLDLIYFDLKIADPNLHREITGRPNRLIWANLAEIRKMRPEIIIPRIPVIPGYTATQSNLRQIAARLKEMGFHRYVLLPYHPFGLYKAGHLGHMTAAGLSDKPMTAESLNTWHTVFQRMEDDIPGALAISRDRVPGNLIDREVSDAN